MEGGTDSFRSRPPPRSERHVAQLDPTATGGQLDRIGGLWIDGSRSMISNIRLPEATARWAIPIATPSIRSGPASITR